MAKDFIKKKIQSTDIVKKNAKTFVKEINSFNKRLKNAMEKHAISKNTYATLMIDKDKRDFFKANIFTKKQFKEFVGNLKSANSKTLKASKKGIGTNFLQVSKYERKLYMQQFKYLQEYDKIYDVDYSDMAINVSKRNIEKVFERLQKAKYITQNKSIRFRINMKKAIDNIFGENKKTKEIKEKLDKLNDKQLQDMLDSNPNIRIEMVYDDKINLDTRIEVLQRGLDEELAKKKGKKKSKKSKAKTKEKEPVYEAYTEEELKKLTEDMF